MYQTTEFISVQKIDYKSFLKRIDVVISKSRDSCLELIIWGNMGVL